ncbi:MAG: futalosine hydrolase [Phycisphaerales bacterium]|jgi:futalosine hydrolase
MDFVRSLFVLAAPAEFSAVARALSVVAHPPLWTPTNARPGLDIVQSGVGKANAAACVAWCLARRPYQRVLSLGIAGALPGSGLNIGDVVVATAAAYADEGVAAPEGFTDIGTLGFAPGAPAKHDQRPNIGQGVRVDCEIIPELPEAHRGIVATVSTCSGTDALAAEVVRRTGAIAEAMEGAAAGFTALRLGAGFGEVRVISNTTGDRGGQRWDIKRALVRLGEIASSLET